MRFTEYAFPQLCDGVERLHGFAKIVERGAFVIVERQRVSASEALPRSQVTDAQNDSRGATRSRKE